MLKISRRFPFRFRSENGNSKHDLIRSLVPAARSVSFTHLVCRKYCCCWLTVGLPEVMMVGAFRTSSTVSPGSGEGTIDGRSDSKKVTRTFVDGFFDSVLQGRQNKQCQTSVCNCNCHWRTASRPSQSIADKKRRRVWSGRIIVHRGKETQNGSVTKTNTLKITYTCLYAPLRRRAENGSGKEPALNVRNLRPSYLVFTTHLTQFHFSFRWISEEGFARRKNRENHHGCHHSQRRTVKMKSDQPTRTIIHAPYFQCSQRHSLKSLFSTTVYKK